MKTMKPIFTSKWSNKAKIEVLYYPHPIKGEHESDRIQLMVYPASGKPRGWIMNVAEAVDIIYGLSKAASVGIEEFSKEVR